MEIPVTFFKNLSPDIRNLLISKRVKVTTILLTETNHQGKQSLISVRNATGEAEKTTRTINVALQPEGVIHHPSAFMGMIGGNPPIQMAGLGRSFKYEENNAMITEAL